METITVGCKLPHGLIIHHPAFPGDVTLKGSNDRNAVGGFGLTDVPAEFAEAWFGRHGKSHPSIRAGLIFTAPNLSDATAMAQERTGVKSGLEPLDAEAPGKGLEQSNGGEE